MNYRVLNAVGVAAIVGGFMLLLGTAGGRECGLFTFTEAMPLYGFSVVSVLVGGLTQAYLDMMYRN